jgi:hypothetical protein
MTPEPKHDPHRGRARAQLSEGHTEAGDRLLALPNLAATDAPPDGATDLAAGTVVNQGQFNWDELPPPIAHDIRKVPAVKKVDAIAEVPERIRQLAERSLAYNVKAVARTATSTAARPRIDYRWVLLWVPSEEVGAKFKAELEKYAKYRPVNTTIPYRDPGSPDGQITARVGNTLRWHLTDSGWTQTDAPVSNDVRWGVRYSVRPFEARKSTAKLPGS